MVSYNIAIFAEIAISVLNGMRGGDRIDPLDLMQLATITFIKKLKTWDETKDSKMITYYYREVRTQMQRFIMANAFSVRQGSVFLQHLAYTLSKIRNTFIQQHEREPSVRELASRSTVSQKTINYCLKVTSLTTTSLDELPPMYKTSDYGDDYHPVLGMVEAINNKLKNPTEKTLFALFGVLEEGESLPDELITELKELS